MTIHSPIVKQGISKPVLDAYLTSWQILRNIFQWHPPLYILTMCKQILHQTTIKHLLIQSYFSGEERIFLNQDVQGEVIKQKKWYLLALFTFKSVSCENCNKKYYQRKGKLNHSYFLFSCWYNTIQPIRAFCDGDEHKYLLNVCSHGEHREE